MSQNTTTAAILESLTDRAKFEQIATSVLRKAEPRYVGIIQTGLNAHGETIVAPVDGLHLIPHSSPPHYVLVQHTTTDRNRLRGKWLTNEDADLPKAIVEAQKVRQNQPTAVFTVVLTTNQRVDPQLALDVYQRGVDQYVVVDIWEQHRLADYLDSTADGHWLRREFLGIEAERLSAELLQQLGHRSLELYRKEVLLWDQGPPVHRKIVDSILANVVSGGPGLCLVSGRSGYGKSVATALALDQWLRRGSIGLWLPARYFRDEASLESALDAWLRSLYPSLLPGAGQLAIELANGAERLLICIDDLNRLPESTRLLNRLASIVAPSSNAEKTESIDRASAVSDLICLAIPVWPEFLSLIHTKRPERSWVQIVAVGEMLPDECSKMIRRKASRLSPTEAREYATRLDHDPFLVGLFTQLIDEQMEFPQLAAVADDVIGRFIDEQIQSICSPATVDLLPRELLNIIARVAHEMIIRKNLRPSWQELANWFGDGSSELHGMRLLVRQTQVCRLDVEDRLDFRHDRLQERFLVDAMANLLQSPKSLDEVLCDPYYSSVVGKALTQAEVTAERLAWLREQSPWVMFEAIRHIAQPSNPHQNCIFDAAEYWAANESNTALDSVLTAISRTLMETDSTRVLQIINILKPSYLLTAAGLRNGSIENGLRFIQDGMGGDFEPAFGNTLWDKIVEHAVHHHREEIARQLRDQFIDRELSAANSNSYLALLGHFRLAGFDDIIMAIWQPHEDQVLEYAIWAAARCPLLDASLVLAPLIKRLIAVRKNDTKSPPDHEYATLFLGWGFRRGITPDALNHLIAEGKQDPKACADISLMVEGIDHPDAAEFLVRNLASGGGSSLWSNLTGFGDGEPHVLMRSPQTCHHIRNISEDPNESKEVRVKAFCLWLQMTGCRNVVALSAIEATSPLFRHAVQHRIKIGDRSVVPELLQLLKSKDMQGWWWVMTHRVWCNELEAYASETLDGLQDQIPEDYSGGSSNHLFVIATLLVKIPVFDGENLLKRHWGHLKFSPRMIHVALRIGSATCLLLANDALSQCPNAVDVFKLAFSTVWSARNPTNPLTLSHLKNLESYLDRMNEDDILFLAWTTEREVGSHDDIAQWIRQHLVLRLPMEDRIRVQVADEMFVESLNRSFDEIRFEPYLGFLFEEQGGQRIIFPERQLRLVDQWLSAHSTVRGLQVAAECLRYIGTRQDLDILQRYDIEGDTAAVERIKADAKFSVCKRSLR